MAPCPMLSIEHTVVILLIHVDIVFVFFGHLMWELYKGGELEQDALMFYLVSCPSQMYKSSIALTTIFT